MFTRDPRFVLALVFVAAGLLAGCQREEISKEEAAFFEELDQRREATAEEYPETSGPEAAPELRWDLAPGKSCVYDYTLDWKAAQGPRVGGGAAVTLTGQEGGGGKVAASGRETTVAGADAHPAAGRFASGSFEIDARGAVQGESPAYAVLPKFFLLPDEPLDVGQSAPASGAFTFLVGEKTEVTLPAEGKTTLAGYSEVNGRTCARLVTELAVNREHEAEGKAPACDARFFAVRYFEVSAGVLVSGHAFIEKGVGEGDSAAGFAVLTLREE
ncbi:MAG: hypothetical protein R6V58_14635 [Planctomycetota bacterium]